MLDECLDLSKLKKCYSSWIDSQYLCSREFIVNLIVADCHLLARAIKGT